MLKGALAATYPDLSLFCSTLTVTIFDDFSYYLTSVFNQNALQRGLVGQPVISLRLLRSIFIMVGVLVDIHNL